MKESEKMRLKKCPMCKIMVPGKLRTCPVCGSEYTKFQYFKMNILSKCILVLLALLVVYNMVVVIVFNRTIKGYVDNPPNDIYGYIERIQCWKGGEKPSGSSAQMYAWLVWDKARPVGEGPVWHWLHRSGEY
jgi:hypothetical protein